MTKSHPSIIDKARRLAQLEKEFLTFTYESKKPKTEEELEQYFEKFLTICMRAFETRIAIITDEDFYNRSAINVPHDVEKMLKKIRHNDKFYSISSYESTAKFLNKNTEDMRDRLDETVQDYLVKFSEEDDFFSKFHEEVDWLNYYYAKMKIGPIISSFNIPKNVSLYFVEIKDSYAFELYRACVALCRALLEMSLYDKLSRKKILKDEHVKVSDIKEAKQDNLFKYIRLAGMRKVLDKKNTSLAHHVRKMGNEVLHLRKDLDSQPVKEEKALDIIINTLEVIEFLYK